MNVHDIPTSWITITSGILGGGFVAELLKGRRTPAQKDIQTLATAAQKLAESKEIADRENSLRGDHLKLLTSQIQENGDARNDGRESMKIALDSMQLNIKNLQELITSHQNQLNEQSKQIDAQRVLIKTLQDQVEQLRQERHQLLTQLQTVELLKSTEGLRADHAETRLREIQEQKENLRAELGSRDEIIKSHEITISYLQARIAAGNLSEGAQINNFTFVEPASEDIKE